MDKDKQNTRYNSVANTPRGLNDEMLALETDQGTESAS